MTYNSKPDPAASYEVYGESGDSEEQRNLHNFETLKGRENGSQTRHLLLYLLVILVKSFASGCRIPDPGFCF